MTEVLDKTGVLSPNDLSGDHLAWSKEDFQSDEEREYNRQLYGIHSSEIPVLDLTEIDEIKQAIKNAPSLDDALVIIFQHPNLNVSQTLTFLEEIKEAFADSEAVTDKIDLFVSKATGIAKQAIAGEIETISPDDAVAGLMKAFNITSNPEVKDQVIEAIDAGIHDAEQNARTDSNSYSLDPIVAASALEVLDDIRHAASPDDIDCENIFERHSRIHTMQAERDMILANALAQVKEYDAAISIEQDELKTVTQKRGLKSAVRNLLRINR